MEYILLEIVLLVLISVLELTFGKKVSKGLKLGFAMVHSSFRNCPQISAYFLTQGCMQYEAVLAEYRTPSLMS